MKIMYLLVVMFLCISNPVIAQQDLDVLDQLSTKHLDSKEISNYKIFLSRLENNKNLTVEQRLLYNYYSCICPFLEINLSDKPPVAESQIRNYVNRKTISALAKGCVELLEYEKKSGSYNKTEEISKFILHSNSLLQYTAATYIREDNYSDAISVIRSVLMLESKKSIQPQELTDAEIVFWYGSAQLKNTELELAEKSFCQAIKIDAKYFDAYYDLARVLAFKEEQYSDQLGNLQKNTDAYEAVKAARLKNRNNIVPVLEKALALKPDNEAIKTTLLDYYEILKMTDKYNLLNNKG